MLKDHQSKNIVYIFLSVLGPYLDLAIVMTNKMIKTRFNKLSSTLVSETKQ